jgi:hypothetical protein
LQRSWTHTVLSHTESTLRQDGQKMTLTLREDLAAGKAADEASRRELIERIEAAEAGARTQAKRAEAAQRQAAEAMAVAEASHRRNRPRGRPRQTVQGQVERGISQPPGFFLGTN